MMTLVVILGACGADENIPAFGLTAKGDFNNQPKYFEKVLTIANSNGLVTVTDETGLQQNPIALEVPCGSCNGTVAVSTTIQAATSYEISWGLNDKYYLEKSGERGGYEITNTISGGIRLYVNVDPTTTKIGDGYSAASVVMTLNIGWQQASAPMPGVTAEQNTTQPSGMEVVVGEPCSTSIPFSCGTWFLYCSRLTDEYLTEQHRTGGYDGECVPCPRHYIDEDGLPGPGPGQLPVPNCETFDERQRPTFVAAPCELTNCDYPSCCTGTKCISSGMSMYGFSCSEGYLQYDELGFNSSGGKGDSSSCNDGCWDMSNGTCVLAGHLCSNGSVCQSSSCGAKG